MGRQDGKEGYEVDEGHLVHAKQVRLSLTNEVLLQGGQVAFLDKLSIRAVPLIPVKELVHLGTLKWVLRIPLVLNVLRCVDEP